MVGTIIAILTIMSVRHLRLARLIEIIHIVSGDPTWSATRLADYFGVSKKRIFDDLKELNAANIPVVFAPNSRGYTLLKETKIPTGVILSDMRLGAPVQAAHEYD